jgi:hypothetical protein
MDYLQGERKEEETVYFVCCVCVCLRSKGEKEGPGKKFRRSANTGYTKPGITRKVQYGGPTHVLNSHKESITTRGLNSSTQERNCLEVQHVCLVITFG